MSVSESRAKSTIHVSGLDPSVDEDSLHYAFIPFGDIINIQFPKPEKSKETHRGYAFIEFESPVDAEAAVDNMNLSQLSGRSIRVTTAKPQKDSFDIAKSRVAVWNQESWMQENVVDDEDRRALQQSNPDIDPMQNLENSIAGPQA
ncbi:uncharacterized protein V2V93DRAFT_373019 [Kockiozyma suomiensis]|uniref:uncharacterized protein n=1 Tax=Kockiozyma suomiensis TaxID=1337062 RepID=UPI0033440F5B